MSSGGALNLSPLEDLDRIAFLELDDRLLPAGAGALAVVPHLWLRRDLDDVDRDHLDAEELLDRLPDLRLVRVLVHAERVLAVLDQAVALLGDHRREQNLVRMKAHEALPWTASSAASLTSSARAQTTAATSTSDGWTTTTRSRLRNDLTSPTSSSVATTSTGRSWPHASMNAAAFFVDGSSNADLSTTARVPSDAWELSTPRSAERYALRFTLTV